MSDMCNERSAAAIRIDEREWAVERAHRLGFTSAQACRLAQITYRQLDYWDRSKLVTPSYEQANGSGTRRRYSVRDIVVLSVISSLTKVGLAPQSAESVLGVLYAMKEDEVAGCFVLVGDRGKSSIVNEAGLVEALRYRTTPVVVAPVPDPDLIAMAWGAE